MLCEFRLTKGLLYLFLGHAKLDISNSETWKDSELGSCILVNGLQLKAYVQKSIRRWEQRGEISDPLMSFSEELERGNSRRFGESVAVSSMIAANAAVCDAASGPPVNVAAINT